MKITMVFDGLQFGGIERVGIEYIKLLNDKGHLIKILNLRPNLDAMENEIPTGVEVIHLPFSRNLSPQRYSKLTRMIPCGFLFYRLIFFIVFLVQKIYKLYYKQKLPTSDVVIAFSGHYNDLTFVSENFNDSKKIAWLHGNEESYNELAPGYFELYKKIKNLVCLSEKDDDKCLEFNKIYNINKKLIYNPINIGDRKIDSLTIGELKKNFGDFILMVGRMAKDKDQSTVIRSLACLKDKYNLKKKLVLVGDGPEKNKLVNLTKALGLEQQIIFAGAHYDVQNYYSAASIYVHSSPAEGLPTVLLEAMYYNLPIASTNSEPGVREILQDNCGLITPVADSEALANSIYQLYNDKSLVEELVKNCNVRINSFKPDFVISSFEDFVNNIVK